METIVLGAGMVGVSTALALQERGHQVVLLDRSSSVRETSYGNAGFIQTEAAEPYAFPRQLRAMLSVALKATNDVDWHLSELPAYLAPLLSYYRHSGPGPYGDLAAVYSQMTQEAAKDHAPLIREAEAGDLIRRDGYRAIFRTGRRFEKASLDAERIRRLYGIESRPMSGRDLAAEEAGLRQPLAGAIHWTGPWTCIDPGGLVEAYRRLFVSRGGTFSIGEAMTLQRAGTGWRVAAQDGPVDAGRAVVALGPWSARLLKGFGYDVPIFHKRGYHRHFTAAGGPRIPMLDVERGCFYAPMRQGLRIGTGADLTGRVRSTIPRQMRRAEASARELFELGPAVEDAPWFGDRPCTVDMLPVVGPAPSHDNLWFHFGHGHQGFTLGPTTARLLAGLMTGQMPAPFIQKLDYRRFLS